MSYVTIFIKHSLHTGIGPVQSDGNLHVYSKSYTKKPENLRLYTCTSIQLLLVNIKWTCNMLSHNTKESRQYCSFSCFVSPLIKNTRILSCFKKYQS